MSTYVTTPQDRQADTRIPKTIHYCWFGGNEKPPLVKFCIESWKVHCPEYSIVEWNEANWDVTKFQYAKDAYSQKKWAFVSDIARLDIIGEHGGIYLDTDVELKRNLDDLLGYSGFMFFEFETRISSGLGFGAEKNNPLILAMLEDYHGRQFFKPNGALNLEACTYYNTTVLEKSIPELLLNDRHQEINGFAFLTTGEYGQIASHHYSASWTDTPKTVITEKRPWKDTKLKRFLRDPQKQKWVRSHMGYRGQKTYEFFAYDLLELGPIYFFKRLILKIKKKIKS